MTYAVLQAAAGFGAGIPAPSLCPPGMTWTGMTCVPIAALTPPSAPLPPSALAPPPIPSPVMPLSPYTPPTTSLVGPTSTFGPTTNGGTTYAPAPAPDSGGGSMDLWTAMSATEKVAVIGAGAALLVLGVVVAKKAFKPNRRSR